MFCDNRKFLKRRELKILTLSVTPTSSERLVCQKKIARFIHMHSCAIPRGDFVCVCGLQATFAYLLNE